MERMEKQLTAVEFIKSELKRLGILDKGKVMTEIFEQAKAMEKEQIIDAYSTGYNDKAIDNPDRETSKQYYNQTFKSE